MTEMFDFDKIIDQFVDKYGFPRKRVIIEIERVFSAMLSRWYGMHVAVLHKENGFRAYVNSKTTGDSLPREIDLYAEKPKGWETFRRAIERNMLEAACIDQYYRHKGARMMAWGTIINIIPGSKLIVQMALAEGFGIFAECLLNRISAHERRTSAFAIGETRAFWVKAIHPVTLNDTPRLSVILNRTAKNLPAMLLKEQLEKQKITDIAVRCSRRFPGHKSFITANKFVPKNAILQVENELHEYVQVNFDKNWRPPCQFKIS